MARNRSRRTAQSSSQQNVPITEVAQLREENNALSNGMEILEESIADLVLRLDDLNWRPLGESADPHALPLQTIRNTSIVTRGLLAVNPLIKRGMALRCAYIFGGGVEFRGLDKYPAFAKNARVNKYLLSTRAQIESESACGTDGNFFLLIKRGKGRNGAQGGATVQRVPITQITGVITDPDDTEDIWFYKRQWATVTSDISADTEEVSMNTVYYPALDYDERANGKPAQYRGYPVDWTARLAHKQADSQTGWLWGAPDLLPVIFWAKAHKEFLENQAALVKAYSRFAFKITAPNVRGVSQAAQKVANAPGTNQLNGDPNSVGATAIMGGGSTISALGRTGGSVDFEAGTPLAGYVAAGLSVPLHELLNAGSESNRSGAESLSTPTVRVMRARQETWEDFYDQIFDYLGMDIEAVFPAIDPEATYRQIQAIAQASDLLVLSALEVRKLTLDAFQLDGDDWDPTKMPSEEELGNLILELQMQKEQIQAQVDAPLPGGKGVSPAAGKSGGTGKPDNGSAKKPVTARKSYGDNSYRNDAGQHAYSNGKNG